MRSIRLIGISKNMQSDKIQLSVIIVNFRSEHNLGECIASIYDKLDFGGKEIIIVNNDEKETLEAIRDRFPEVRIIKSDKNIGFGSANNLGVRSAEGEFLLFLNPDARILSGKLEDIFQEFDEENNLGILGTRLVTKEGKTQKWSAGGKIDLLDVLRNNLGFPKNEKIWASPVKREVAWVAATALFIRKALFKKIEGFDEKMFMYFEDIDLCMRINDLGYKVLYFPNFSVLHLGGESYKNQKDQKKHYYTSQDYYFKKHCDKAQYYAIKALKVILNK